MITLCKLSCGHMFLFLLEKYLGVKISFQKEILISKKLSRWFPKWLHPFAFPPAVCMHSADPILTNTWHSQSF